MTDHAKHVTLAAEWVGWADAKGEAFEPATPHWEGDWARALVDLDAEVRRLRALLDTPQTADFFEAVRLEAAHQIDRWGTEHDAGKTPADWFWLIGYLAGKALHDVRGKAAYHVIAAAAALLNWHRALTGESTEMRPGIEPPP